MVAAMGLLDDAIREHLELKRLRGADPSDVIRQEREALGAGQHGDPIEETFGSAEEEEPRGAPSRGAGESPARDDDEADDLDELWAASSAGQTDAPRPKMRGERRGGTDQETAEVDMIEMLDMEEGEGAAGLDRAAEPEPASGDPAWADEGAWGDSPPARTADDQEQGGGDWIESEDSWQHGAATDPHMRAVGEDDAGHAGAAGDPATD
jgi:hypothetical protein